jgi:hypothetical protein
MTEDTMAFLDEMQKRGGADFLKELAGAVLQWPMEFDVEGRCGAIRTLGGAHHPAQRLART